MEEEKRKGREDGDQEVISIGHWKTVCKKTQGFVGFNPLGSEEANISKTETE